MQPYTTGLTGLFPFSPTEAAFIVTELAERGLTASVTEDDILIDGVGSYLTITDARVLQRLRDCASLIARSREASQASLVPAIQGYREQPAENIGYVNRVKAAVNAYGALLDELDNLPGVDKRWLAIARTDAQTSSMAACRAIMRPSSFA